MLFLFDFLRALRASAVQFLSAASQESLNNRYVIDKTGLQVHEKQGQVTFHKF
jgi:hypothetical protein